MLFEVMAVHIAHILIKSDFGIIESGTLQKQSYFSFLTIKESAPSYIFRHLYLSLPEQRTLLIAPESLVYGS